MGVKVVVCLMPEADFLEDVSFAEIRELVVFQVPSEFEMIGETAHGHGIAQAEIEFGHLEGADVVGLFFLGFRIDDCYVDAVSIDRMVG